MAASSLEPLAMREMRWEASWTLPSSSPASSAYSRRLMSVPKTKAMHIHSKERVSKTTEAEVAALNLKHRCPECTREFPTKRGLAIHRSRWCLHHPSTANTRSRTGTLADKEVQRQKRLAKEKERPHVTLQGEQLENVHAFDYLGSRMQCDGDQEADVNYRMVIAQTRFSSLQHIWRDHRLPHSMKVRLYKSSVCSTLTHSCEAWDLTRDVTRMINGFNSRCLQVITKKHFRDTATNPDYNLMLTIRRRRLRYLGHILRMDPSRLVRRTLEAYVCGGDNPPEGSLLMDCEHLPFDQATKWRWAPPYARTRARETGKITGDLLLLFFHSMKVALLITAVMASAVLTESLLWGRRRRRFIFKKGETFQEKEQALQAAAAKLEAVMHDAESESALEPIREFLEVDGTDSDTFEKKVASLQEAAADMEKVNEVEEDAALDDTVGKKVEEIVNEVEGLLEEKLKKLEEKLEDVKDDP
ncbi:hypothetical protein Bbelb_305800 [Branchiostoma belcheri]|nr:hypothetical protein Bbelb_305800 [Branchiostoma belcheri]